MKNDQAWRWPLSLLSGLLLGACVSERVVLLPSPDGRPTAVVVRDASGEVVLDKPYAGVQRRAGENAAYQSSPAEVAEHFGTALAAQPSRPGSFTVYFESGGETLTAESQAALKSIEDEIAARPASEVRVIGHTDTVGIPVAKIEIAGRGEREPLVASGDEVAEAQNRRVEISVR